MFHCKRCEVQFIDGVQCSICQGRYDFPCAGITETGYRKLGDRRYNWKCTACKSGASSPRLTASAKTSPNLSPLPADIESIALDIKRLSTQISSIPDVVESIRTIQADMAELKTMRADIAELKAIGKDMTDMKASFEFMQHSLDSLTNRIAEVDHEVQNLIKTKDSVHSLQQRLEKLESSFCEYDQRSRLNNVEIKGVPISSNEDLFALVLKITNLAKCPISKELINYVARVPTRNDKQNKSIIISVHNRYLKDDLVAAAKKCNITPSDLGLNGNNRIYINDHLTLENKILLNKAKVLGKERNFAFIWVKSCKIYMRKNSTSPVIQIKSELDLQKISRY